MLSYRCGKTKTTSWWCWFFWSVYLHDGHWNEDQISGEWKGPFWICYFEMPTLYFLFVMLVPKVLTFQKKSNELTMDWNSFTFILLVSKTCRTILTGNCYTNHLFSKSFMGNWFYVYFIDYVFQKISNDCMKLQTCHIKLEKSSVCHKT